MRMCVCARAFMYLFEHEFDAKAKRGRPMNETNIEIKQKCIQRNERNAVALLGLLCYLLLAWQSSVDSLTSIEHFKW